MIDDKFEKTLSKCQQKQKDSMKMLMLGQVEILRKIDYAWLERAIVTRMATSESECGDKLAFNVPILVTDLSTDEYLYNDLLPGQSNDCWFISHAGKVSAILSTVGRNAETAIAPVIDTKCIQDKKVLTLDELEARINAVIELFSKEFEDE